MKRDKIVKMEAGKEIDTAVSVEVCKFSQLPVNFSPSKNLKDAFSVLEEKFDRTVWDIDISSDTEDEGKRWGVNLTEWSDKPIGSLREGWAVAETLQLAICRAVLLAVME